jgi:hypothetical protein
MVTTECPGGISYPCWDGQNIIWDNGDSDGANGISMLMDPYRSVLDDFIVEEEVLLTDFHATLSDAGGGVPVVTGYDLILWDDIGGAPGQPVMVFNTTLQSVVPTGRTWFGFNEYMVNVCVEPTPIPPGIWWMEMHVQAGGNTWNWVHATDGVGPEILLTPLYICYTDFPPCPQPGSAVFGADYGLNFCLTGDDCGVAPGACCDDATGICIEDVPEEECQEPLRWGGAGSTCDTIDPPCEEACPDAEITIEVVTDSWGYETSWELETQDGVLIDALYGSYGNNTYNYHRYCVDADCYIFTIYDDFGDGIYAPGGYRVTYNGEVICDNIGSGWSGDMEVCGPFGDGCAEPTGACCVGTECVATLTEAECDAIQGYWYEGETCPEFECPLPLPCWDATVILWDNGDTDGSNGYSGYFDLGRFLLDDFEVPEGGVTITDFHQTYIWNSLPPGSGTDYYLAVYEDVGGAPGALISELNTTLVSEVPTGRVFFGRNEAIGNVAVEPFYLDAGIYWLEMTPIGEDNCFEMIHEWLTMTESWWRADDLGYYGPGSGYFGGDGVDVNFCLTGDAPPTGACCDMETGDCVDDVPFEDCPAPLRFEAGVLCADLDPPCGPPTGACCVDQECVATTTEPECDVLGGDWYEGQTCPEFQCPLPPLDCGESVYDNGAADFSNIYAAQCSPPDAFTVELADDFVLDADENITAISVAVGFYGSALCGWEGVTGLSVAIYNDAGGIPGGNHQAEDCSRVGDVVWTQQYAPGEWTLTDLGGPSGETQVDLQTGGVALSGGVTYWLGIMMDFSLGDCGQCGASIQYTTPIGSNPLFYSDYFGIYWGDPLGTPAGIVFCLHAEPTGGNCGDYLIGDYNCSGATNVADVVEMYSKLKTGAPVYPDCECDCLDDGNVWPVGGDVNSSCAMNVADVVDLYSKLKTGEPELTPCMDCPPDSWLNPGGGDRPLVVPNLESKAKLKTGSGMD